ncbi:MAG: hypothetical protein ABSE73_11600, partial [Planctomycetota bacterium]
MSERSTSTRSGAPATTHQSILNMRSLRHWISVVSLLLTDIATFALATLLFRVGHTVPALLFYRGLLPIKTPIVKAITVARKMVVTALSLFYRDPPAAIPPLPAAPPPGQPAAVPEAKPDAPMSPEEAVAALKALFATPAAAAAELDKTARDPGSTEPPKPPQGLVSAVNVPPEIGTLMAMLGVDRFVKIRGTYDLGQLETTILSEKNLTRDEQFRIILKTHSALIEIDQRNQARFGPLLQGLSQALEDEK